MDMEAVRINLNLSNGRAKLMKENVNELDEKL